MKTMCILSSALVAVLLMSITQLSRASTVYTESFEGTISGTLSGTIDQVAVEVDPAYGGQATDGTHFLAFNANSVGGLTETAHDATGGSFTSSDISTSNGYTYTLSFDYGMFNGPGPQMITVTATDQVTTTALLTQNISDSSGNTDPDTVMSPYLFTFAGSGNPIVLEFLDTTTNVHINDGLLDHIVVTVNPEPASLGMLGVASLLLFPA